jgi:hypothetical protein
VVELGENSVLGKNKFSDGGQVVRPWRLMGKCTCARVRTCTASPKRINAPKRAVQTVALEKLACVRLAIIRLSSLATVSTVN